MFSNTTLRVAFASQTAAFLVYGLEKKKQVMDKSEKCPSLTTSYVLATTYVLPLAIIIQSITLKWPKKGWSVKIQF